MIDTQTVETDANVKQRALNAGSMATSPKPDPSVEGFLRVMAVVAGMILGAITALIVGLATGWIPFAC